MIKRPKTPQRAALAAGRKKSNHQEDDFYANMAALSDDDMESDISEADVDLVAKSLDDLDDMDAHLFGGHKKNTEKPLPKAVSSPRRTAGASRSLSPPTRTGNPVTSSSNSVSKTPNKESEEKIIPSEKTKPSVEDDIDLSGLLSDDDSSFLLKETLESASKKSSVAAKPSTTEPFSIPKSSTATKQATPVINAKEVTPKDDSDLAGLFSDDESLLLPTTGKDQNTTANENPASSTKPTLSSKSQKNTNSVAKETKESPVKKAVTFSKDDDIFDGLGLEEKPNDTSRPSRSALDDLFGKSSPPPLTFNTDKTETSQAGKLLMGSADTEKENDDFLFGSYLPSSAAESASNIPSRGSRLEAESEKVNKRSEIVPTRQRSSVSPKSSFDDDDDKIDWLKISSEHGSKSSGKSETAKVADSDDDDDDWLGMKSSKKSVSFNLGDGLDIDLSPDIPLSRGQIRGGARSEKEIKPSTSASVTEKEESPSQSSVTKETLETKPSKPGVKTTKNISPKKETQKESQLKKKPEPIMLPGTHTKEMPSTADEEEELLQQLESINLMPSLKMLPAHNLGAQHLLPSTSGPTKSPNPVNLRPRSADTHMSSSSFEKLTDAEIRISRLQIEKEQLEILIESVKKRCSEEIEAIEQSYKSRLQLLEETHEHKERRWKEENEQLLKQHLQKMQQLEQEKSELTTRHYNILQSCVDEHGSEVQRLKGSHQTAMELQRKEFEEALYRMKEVKQREVDSVENFQSTSKSLYLVIEQIQANAKDLNVFQQKLDQWQIDGMDEREMSIRARDQQLKFFQERLSRQQEENARERSRLEELIGRLEGQLHSQTQLLDDERWKVKQEVNKYHVLQASVEAEKRQWGEQQAREKATMEKSRSALMEEQRQLMSQLFEERRALAEEKVHMEVSRKLWAEREQKNSFKAVKIETEFDATMKALEEERNKSSVQLELAETEKKALREDRKKFEKEHKNFEDEKMRLTEMASQIKMRSKEIESLFAEAQKIKEEGEMALVKSNKMDFAYSQRWRDLMTQMDNLTEEEKQAAAERITLAQERDHLETLRKNLMCINCRNSLSGGSGTVNGRVPKMTATFTSANTGSAFWGGYQPETIPVQATEDSSPLIQDTIHAIRTDQWLRQLKKQSLKDKEFLLGEKVYLATLENPHYQHV